MLEPTTVHIQERRSRHPFVPAASKLLNELSKLSIQAAQWTDYKCLKVNQSYASLFQGPVLGHLAWICPDLLGYYSTAFALVLKDSSHSCTNGGLLLHQSVNMVH